MNCEYCMADPCECASMAVTSTPAKPSKFERATLIAIGERLLDDGVVTVGGAWRDLNSKGNGTESYRRILRANATTWGWLTSERLPRGTFLAADRRARVFGDASIGDIVASFSRSVRSGCSAGAVTLDGFDLVVGGDDGKVLTTLAFEKRRVGYQLTLPGDVSLAVADQKW